MANNLAELNVLVGADVKPLQEGLNQAKASVVNFSNLANSLNNLRPFSPFIVKGIEAAKTVDQLKDALAQLKIEQGQALNPKEIQAYNNAIKSVSIEIKSLTTASSQASTVTKTLSSAFSSIRQLAYVLPGIGIAGIFSAIFEVISEAVSELDVFATQSAIVTEAVKDQNSAFAQSAGNIAKETSNINALVGAARDENLTREQRNNAIKELQRIYPGVLDNLNAENINSQAATIAINKLTESIIRKSKAEAIAGLISKTQSAIFEQQNKPLEEQLTMINKIKALFLSAGGTETAAIGLVNDALGNQSTNVKELNALLSGYQKQLQGVVTEEAKAGDFEVANPAKVKSMKTLSSILDELNRKFEVLGSEEDIFGENLNPERINLIKTAITDLLNIGVSSTAGVVQQLAEEIMILQDAIDNARQKIDLFGAKGGVTAPKAPTAPAQTTVIPLNDLADQGLKVYANTQAKIKAGADALNQQLADSLKSSFVSVFEGLGEALGDAISGKGNVFQKLGQSLGGAIKALGAQLIKLGFAAKVIQTAISKLLATPAGPVLVVAGGIALEAIGTAISNLGVTPHAEGGIFDKPTLIGSHLFGEKGPEALIPLNRLDSMLGKMGGGSNIEVTGRLELGFDKLRIALERANRFTDRNYGAFNNG